MTVVIYIDNNRDEEDNQEPSFHDNKKDMGEVKKQYLHLPGGFIIAPIGHSRP